MNTHALNAQTLNGTKGAFATEQWAADSQSYYTLALHEPDGTLIRVLYEWNNGTWYEEINRPTRITFTHRNSIDGLSYPNEIWLRRGLDCILYRKCTIVQVRETIGGNASITIEAEDFMGQLGRETVNRDIDYIGSPITLISQILSQDQSNSYPVTLGSVDPCLNWDGFSWKCSAGEKTILQALNTIIEDCGGLMFVNSYRQLNWVTDWGVNIGHQIRLDKNAFSIIRNRDYRSGTAKTDLDLSIIDLGTKGVDYNFDSIMLILGTRVRVFVEDPAIDLATRITSIERNLDVPSQVKIAVSDSTRVTVHPNTGGTVIDQGRRDNLVDIIANLFADVQDMPETVLDRFISIADDDTDGYYEDLQGATMSMVMDAVDSAGDLIDAQYMTWWDLVEHGGDFDEHLADVLEQSATARNAVADAITEVLDNTSGSVRDNLKDAISDVIREVLADDTGAVHDALVEALQQDSNIWVEYTG